MGKIYIKLVAMALALTLSVSVLIMSSYAWMVLSSNPAATGIQVIIGGGNTILVAPNIEETVDEKTYNIPGRFSDKMNFAMPEYRDSYGHLSEVAGLTPVSTSNGIDWFVSGNKVDSFLLNANLPKTVEDEEGKTVPNPKIAEGSYIYLDFWVVSPSGDYKLRISTGEGASESGSFVVDLLEPAKNEEEKLVLKEPKGSAAAAVRIGFLANPVTVTDETMNIYLGSRYKDDRFTALRGLYMEPGTGAAYFDSERFTIFEPNGNYHPLDEEIDGTYVQTKPLMLDNGEVKENGDIWENLTVQMKSDWILASYESSQSLIEQKFQTAVLGNTKLEGKSSSEISGFFYGEYLQGYLVPFVSKGAFVGSSGSLEQAAGENGKISEEALSSLVRSTGNDGFSKFYGATEDVYIIELERNIPQRIRMFIWLEGQDVDCAASRSSARFAVNIELAGGEAVNDE